MKVTTKRDSTSMESGSLYVALELSKNRWLVRSAVGPGQRSRQVSVPGGDWRRLLSELDRARAHFGVSATSAIMCCYEAGRDGFWLARCLAWHGVRCLVVDAGSLRRRPGKRHRKTDRLDAETLLRDLMRYASGDGTAFRTVHVPSEADEDLRQVQRERQVLIGQRTAELNRIRGLLMSRGIRVEKLCELTVESLEDLRTWDAQPLGAQLQGQLRRCLGRVRYVQEQLGELERRRKELLQEGPEEHRETLECVERLMQLRSIGPETSWTLSAEMFGWRKFRNRRQVGGYVGLCGTPHQSGEMDRDLGIGKDGPGWVRAQSIELAWSWLRFQPDSALSRWFQERYSQGKRNRRRGIVALARRLLVALWQYLEYGVLPDGAILKSEVV